MLSWSIMKKQYILGISAYYHDSSACLIHGGEIIAAISEERFSRLKHDLKFPSQSIKYCLKEANIKLTDVDSITYYEKPLTTFERLLETYFRNSPFGFNLFRASFPIWVTNKIFIKSKIINELMSLFSVNKVDIPKLLFCPHHLSHAASAFYPSPFQSAAILCIDGVGEYATTTIWHGRNNKLHQT